MQVDRRVFVAGGVDGMLASRAAADAGTGSPVRRALGRYAGAYMAARGAPGMIVGMADRGGWSDAVAYGVADLDSRRPIGPEERFHIGSITKSFTALMILQLVEEGKVALDADVTAYLPGLPLRTPFGRVTVHHLLCHAGGLPGAAPPPGWPDPAVEQAFAPGTRFHYSNLGYEWLGRIVEARGGEGWSRALGRRVLAPLGMDRTSPVIGAATRRFEVPGHVRREDDRPYPPGGPLTRAGPQTFTAASGCIASTAGDMNRYIAMLTRRGGVPGGAGSRGGGPGGRLLSRDSFALMTRGHVDDPEGGPGARYGYGWMIGAVGGRPVIRHTGGMIAFMSSIHVDLDAGVGAFASINAQQNYRPVPVTAHALALLRARAGGAPAKAPSVEPDADLDPAEFRGRYARADGTLAVVTTEGRRLRLAIDGRNVALESLGGDAFACRDPRYRLFTFLFRRAARATTDAADPVVALDWGRDSFVRAGSRAPRVAEPDRAAVPASRLGTWEGLYVADGSWLNAVRVVLREGRLWIDSFNGVVPLASLGGDRFRFADAATIPDTVAFAAPPGSPAVLLIGGTAMTRAGDPFMELG